MLARSSILTLGADEPRERGGRARVLEPHEMRALLPPPADPGAERAASRHRYRPIMYNLVRRGGALLVDEIEPMHDRSNRVVLPDAGEEHELVHGGEALVRAVWR